MKKKLQKLIFLLGISLFASSVNAQVTVTGSTGADGPYTTLGAAFTAINAGAQTGNTISIVLSAGTTETATATLNAGAWTSVNITATVPVTITGNIGGAIIKLNGADFVTIDGRIAGSGRNISVINTSTAASAAIWLSSTGAGAGATNNVIRNLEIACGVNQNTATTSTFGIIMCGSTISATSNGDDNDNNTFTENRIIRCRYGIVTRGVTTNNNINIQVTNNIIGPNSFGADEIGRTGIFMQADFQSAVTGNTVQFVGGDFANTSGGADRVGIAIGVDAWSNSPGIITSSFYLVSNNLVHDIIEERTNSAVGILLGTTNGGSPTSNIVSNNMIYNVKANGTLGDALVGIGISGGNADQVIHNSIYLYGDVDPNASATATSMYGSGIRIANANSGSHANLIVRYNNIHMDVMSSSTPAARYYAISGNSAAYSFGTGGENYNNYYLNPSNPQLMTGGLGSSSGNTLGTQFATLLDWKTAYTANQDANSFQTNSSFTSTTNLHIPAATNTLLESGATGSTLTLDYDGDTRPGPTGSVNGGGTTPDIGADEFDGIPIANCSGTPAASNAQSSAASVCSGVNFNLTLSLNYIELGYTYQWQSSPDGVTYTNIGGATTASYTTSQTAVTYYQCIITCTNSGMSTTTTPVQVTMNPFTACYCTPTFPGNVEPITLVNFAGINNSTSPTLNGTPALENFTAMTGNVMEGQTYPISLKGNTDGNYTTYLSVYIDFNQNGVLDDAGETFNVGTITNSTGIDAITLTGNITIPMGVTAGNTRMRVVKKFSSNGLPCNNAGFGQAEDYTLNITLAPTCSGTPTAGTITPGSTGVCSGTNFTLNLTGYSTDNNITLQWQSSPDGLSYTNIVGANSSTYSTSITSDTYFQCVVTCTTSGMSAIATPVFYTINPFYNCYCAVTFPSNVEPITLVDFAGINNTTSNVVGGSPAQENFTAMTANVNKGYTYPITLKGNTDGNFVTYLSVFIDFNQNGLYTDLGETFNIGTITNSTGIDAIQLTGNITIPMTATTGLTGMRVIKKFNANALPCNNTGFGQAEDYTIMINPCVPPSIVSLTASDADGAICPGQSVTFTGPTGYVYNDFQLNAGSVQTGTGNTYTNGTLANGDVVTLVAGYDVTCATAATPITITHHAIPVGTISPVDASCNGASDGSMDLTVTSGTPSYTYLWSNSAITEDISGLIAGTYSVTITDGNGCTGTASAGIAEPSAINVNVTQSNVSCFGGNNGSFDLTVTGGAGGYTFDWDNDGTGDFDDAEDLSSLVAGTYNGVVMDMNGCTDGGAVIITEPVLLDVTATATDISCNGSTDGSINATVTGGTTAYTFDWDNDGTGDFNDLEDLSALAAGTYNLTVEDANGCTATASATVIEPAVLSATASPVDISCNGANDGMIALTVAGGTSPFTYDWDNDGTGDNDDTEDLSALAAGTYNVTVTDDNGCTTTASAGITEPSAINVTVSTVDASCFGLSDGAIDLTVSGGTAPYDFDWDIDGTGDFDDTEDLTGLPAGIYVGALVDANGCTDGGSITISEPTEILPTVTATDITCFGDGDGSIDLSVTGGAGSYTYDWDNDGTGDNDDTEDLSALAAGTYAVNIIDADNCSVTTSASITEPGAITTSVTATDISCNGSNDGSVDLTITGGTSPFTIDWDNDGTGDNDDAEDLTGLSAGTYNVIVMDVNGCPSSSANGTVVEPAALILTPTITNANCDNSSDGAIDLAVTGGTGAYTYDWDNDGTGDNDDTEDLSGLSSGNFTVFVTDANGCSANNLLNVPFDNVSPTVTLTVSPSVACNTEGVMTLGGESPTGGIWSGNGVTGSTFDPAAATIGLNTITYTFTDGNGCSNSAQDDIQVDDCSGITENASNAFNVYPNPTLGMITITSDATNGNIIIRDAIGKVVYSAAFISEKIMVDMTNYSRGIYTITLETSTGNMIQKVVKD